MSKIFTPTNQKLLTNVCVVRLKKTGKRFEVACYKNKVISWRNESEKDLDEVLQTKNVFANVTRGELAKKDDLTKAFGTADQVEICKEILKKGELQVSEKERQANLDATFKEIATLVSEKCVHLETNRPFTVTTIEKAMRDCHFSIKPNKNVKSQALGVIKMLKEHLPIDKAQMRVKITVKLCKESKKLREELPKLIKTVESESPEFTIALIDPGSFKTIDELINSSCKGNAAIEVLSLKNIDDSEETF